MFKKISNFWHILKAKVVVFYALFSVPKDVIGINYLVIRRRFSQNLLFFIRQPRSYFNSKLTLRILSKDESLRIKDGYNTLHRDFFRKYIAHRKTSLANYVYVKIECPALGSYFARIIGIAWLCEKLSLNVKYIFPDTYLIGSTDFFENSVLSYSKTCQPEKFAQLREPLVDLDYWNEGTLSSIWEEFAKRKIPSKYGHEVISKLSVKQDIQQQADQWWRENAGEKYIGIHYRQTDVIGEHRIIDIESYLGYLKQVIDDNYYIFACSDNVQFIDAIHKEFPNKVATRDIPRSDDCRSLHRHAPYAGDQQRKDALIDILILAKTEIIYTVGSFFVDVVRFFNPSIKIISLDGREERRYRQISNYLPVPQKHLAREAREQTAWKRSSLAKGIPPNIESKRK